MLIAVRSAYIMECTGHHHNVMDLHPYQLACAMEHMMKFFRAVVPMVLDAMTCVEKYIKKMPAARQSAYFFYVC